MIRNAAALAFTVILAASCGSGSGSGSGVSPAHALAGDWRGSWASSRGPIGSVTATLQQSGATIAGSAILTGAACPPPPTLSGRFTGADTVELDVGGLRLIGRVSSGGAAIDGTYTVSGGPCNGDRGSWHLYRAPAFAWRGFVFDGETVEPVGHVLLEVLR